MNDATRRTVSFLPLLCLTSLIAAGCDDGDLFCAYDTCGFSDDEWARLASLADLPASPPLDRSNAYERNLVAQQLGQEFYFDPRFSGPATQVDALGRPSPPARAFKGAPSNVSCATCHDLDRGGIDVTSQPNNVSAGAGWTDVNALSTVNSSYQHLYFSNGRADSQWALAAAVAESPTTMNGNRLQTAWLIRDAYAARYAEVFGQLPLELLRFRLCEARALVIPSGPLAGQCSLGAVGTCNFPCVDRGGGCWPPVPLDGKPGHKNGCQAGDPTEPFGDAWDCLDEATKRDLTGVLVNWAKALAAFESQLTSVQSPFDDFMDEGSDSRAISAQAQWGARLFVGKAGCFDCHNTSYFSDRGFHDVGVRQVGFGVPTMEDCPADATCASAPAGPRCLPWGAYDGLCRSPGSAFLRTSTFSDDPRSAAPASPAAVDPGLKGAWRTPTLRNVALTAPYMHDGIYRTLDEVVDHYDRGGDASVGPRDAAIRPLGLTDAEKRALVAFLRTLTGKPLAAFKRKAPTLAPGSVCP